LTSGNSLPLKILFAVAGTILLAIAIGWFWFIWPEISVPNKTADELAIEFDTALATRKFRQAGIVFRQFEKVAAPDDERRTMNEARLNLALERNDRALELLNQIPESSKTAPMARRISGQVHLRAGRLVPAEKDFLTAIRLDPTEITAHRELIYIYGLQLRRKELRNIFEKLSRISPMRFQNVFHWCLTRGNDWEPQEIVDDMTKFLAADPSDKWSMIALSRSLRRQVKLDEAENALKPLPDADPDAAALRAQLALDRNDADKARSILQNTKADNFELSMLRAQMALAEGGLDEAEKQFRIAAKIDPDNRDAVVGLARTLAAAGKKDEAKFYQERSTNLDRLASLIQEAAKPGAEKVADLPKRLATACEAVGHLPEARAWWGVMADINPLDSEAQQAIYRIDQSLAGKKP
jgi:tetratricopeptide (TPR) repeat protein